MSDKQTEELFDDYAENYASELVKESDALTTMHEARDLMNYTSLRVELEVISEAGGDPKKVGSTEFDRKRNYDLARESSTQYTNARELYYIARQAHYFHKGMVRLAELQMQFAVAVAKS